MEARNFRNFSKISAIFPQVLLACPPLVLVGAPCVPCAEVLPLEALGGLVTRPQFSRHCLQFDWTPPDLNPPPPPGPGWPAVEPSLFVMLGCLPNRPNGGCRLVVLSKPAKKHSIAADCGELKATFSPRLRGTAKAKVTH